MHGDKIEYFIMLTPTKKIIVILHVSRELQGKSVNPQSWL